MVIMSIMKEAIENTLILYNSTKYRIFNNYNSKSAIVRTYYKPDYKPDFSIKGKIIAQFPFNIPINPNSINRILNLKSFL